MAKVQYFVWASDFITKNNERQFGVTRSYKPIVHVYLSVIAVIVVLLIHMFVHMDSKGYTDGDKSADDTMFAISPDGKTVAFTSPNKIGGRGIYLLNLQKQIVTQLTNTSLNDNFINYAPNGRSIVFVRTDAHDVNRYLYLIDPTTGHIHQITGNFSGEDTCPFFSRDGKLIVFCRSTYRIPRRGGIDPWTAWDIYTMKPDGTSVKQITHMRSIDELYPQLHKVGEDIVFTVDNSSTRAMYRVSMTGSSRPEHITTLHGHNIYDEELFPNGKTFACVSDIRDAFDDDIYLGDISVPAFVVSLNVAHDGKTAPGFLRVSNEGQSLYYLRSEQIMDSLWQVNIDGTGDHEIAGNSLFIHPLQWHSQTPKVRSHPRA